MFESELTNIVYDALMGNVGMSDNHIGLNLDDVEDQEVDAVNCKIRLTIGGDEFVIRIDKTFAGKPK